MYAFTIVGHIVNVYTISWYHFNFFQFPGQFTSIYSPLHTFNSAHGAQLEWSGRRFEVKIVCINQINDNDASFISDQSQALKQ